MADEIDPGAGLFSQGVDPIVLARLLAAQSQGREGGSSGLDPQIQALVNAQTMQAQSGPAISTEPIRSPWQGARLLAQGLSEGLSGLAAARQGQAANSAAASFLNSTGGTGAPSSPAIAPAASNPAGGQSTADADLIKQAAGKYGIDPNVAIRVAKSEGLNSYVGDHGSSFGPFQLHYGGVAGGGNAVSGLGDDFTKQTGLDARDPRTKPEQIDFALKTAAQTGWGPWHGAQRVGIGNHEGIGAPTYPQVASANPSFVPQGGHSLPPGIANVAEGGVNGFPTQVDTNFGPQLPGGSNPTPVPATGGYGPLSVSQGPALPLPPPRPPPASPQNLALADALTTGRSAAVQPAAPIPASAVPQPQSFGAMLAQALGGGGQSVPDGRGGFVPATNSRVNPDGSLRPPTQAEMLANGLAGRPILPAASPVAGAGLNAPVAGTPPGSLVAGAGTAQTSPIAGRMADTSTSDPRAAALAADRASHPFFDVNKAAAYAAMPGLAPSYKAVLDAKIKEAQEGRYVQWTDADGNLMQAKVGSMQESQIRAAAKPELKTEIVKLNDGTFQTVNKSTGEVIGQPVGHPAEAPRPVTAGERKTWGLPEDGAFTIAPGEPPKQISGTANQESRLDQPSIDFLANRVNQGDSSALTGLGYGSVGATNRSAVIKRAAELSGPDAAAAASSQIGNQVGLSGRKQEARTSGALGARINTFAEEAARTGELALAASEAMPRGQWVPINAIEQMGEAAHSNKELSALQAANFSFANTYSKMVNPSGAMTDDARNHDLALLNVAKSQEAYEATVRQLQKEGRQIQNSVGFIRAQQQGGGAPPSYGQPAAPAASGAPLAPGETTTINGIKIQRVN